MVLWYFVLVYGLHTHVPLICFILIMILFYFAGTQSLLVNGKAYEYLMFELLNC